MEQNEFNGLDYNEQVQAEKIKNTQKEQENVIGCFKIQAALKNQLKKEARLKNDKLRLFSREGHYLDDEAKQRCIDQFATMLHKTYNFPKAKKASYEEDGDTYTDYYIEF